MKRKRALGKTFLASPCMNFGDLFLPFFMQGDERILPREILNSFANRSAIKKLI
jgi:hypothetical protein